MVHGLSVLAASAASRKETAPGPSVDRGSSPQCWRFRATDGMPLVCLPTLTAYSG